MLRAIVFNSLRKATSPALRGWLKSSPLFIPVSRALFGTQVYCDSYFRDIERLEVTSVTAVADWIVLHLNPRSVLDIGCGPGHQMKALADRGVTTRGIDIAQAALAIAKGEKGLNVQPFDLTDPSTTLPGVPYDLALSCEVAEHLPAKHAPRFVEHCTQASSTIYLTAAEPSADGSTGLHHFNEQPNDYWINLFAQQRYALDEPLTRDARAHHQAKGVISYLARPMIFRKS
jgi:SAM-dependent methyltransferase